MKYNGEFKIIDTEEKAYFLGQIYGDGYNTVRPSKFSMASINTDIDMYKRLNQLFPFTKLKFFKSHPNIVYLENHTTGFCNDLKNLGMISNKTIKDWSGEFHFPELPKNLVHHFIRGFFDADGSVYLPKRYRSRNNLRIEFGLSTPNFIKILYQILKDNSIDISYYERIKRAGNGKYYKSYILLSSNREVSLKFADYIYKDATIYLERKYNMCYSEKVNMTDNSVLYSPCPHCNSKDIVKKGPRKMKFRTMQRLECKNCHKQFSIEMPPQ